jgi:hypothetical protein
MQDFVMKTTCIPTCGNKIHNFHFNMKLNNRKIYAYIINKAKYI